MTKLDSTTGLRVKVPTPAPGVPKAAASGSPASGSGRCCAFQLCTDCAYRIAEFKDWRRQAEAVVSAGGGGGLCVRLHLLGVLDLFMT